MNSLKKWLSAHFQDAAWPGSPNFRLSQFLLFLLLVGCWLAMIAAVIYAGLHPSASFAAGNQLPGEDASGKLEAAGILLKTLDTGLFKWGARIFAGICIMSSAWALKEQRFGIAVICVIGAIIFGTAPKWVRNIFDIGDNQSLFSQVEYRLRPSLHAHTSHLALVKKAGIKPYV